MEEWGPDKNLEEVRVIAKRNMVMGRVEIAYVIEYLINRLEVAERKNKALERKGGSGRGRG